MCSCSDKHRALSHGRWLSNRVQHHCVHRHEECAINDGTPYTELQCHLTLSSIKGQVDSMETTRRVWKHGMGGFHVTMNYLYVLGKSYQSSGNEDLLIESGMYDSSTISIMLKGKSYNRGVRTNNILMDAMFRLQWRAFVQWLSQQEDSRVAETLVIEQVIACLQTLDEGKDIPTAILWKLASAFVCHCCNDTARVLLLNGSTQLFQVASGWWFYTADMGQLSETHTAVHEEFVSGNHSISRSTQPFAQVWTDMALEQSFNIDSKTTGGIIGISHIPGVLECLFLTATNEQQIQQLWRTCLLCQTQTELVHTQRQHRDGCW